MSYRMVILTFEMIEAGKSREGGWSRRQLGCLGVGWPPKRGWMRRLIGRRVAEPLYTDFLTLKDAHLDPAESPDDLAAMDDHLRAINTPA